MGAAQHMSRTMLKLTLLLAAVSASFALNRSVIATPNAPGAIVPYAQGQLLTLASGERMIHAAGQIGLDPSTGALAPGGITGQAPQAMNNVQAIIESVPGASMADVYECTVLMANLTEYAAFNLVYAKYFQPPYPARAAYQVAQLPKEARVEVKCSAGL